MEKTKRRRKRVWVPGEDRQSRSVGGSNRKRVGEFLIARPIQCDYCGATFQEDYYRLDHQARFAGIGKHPILKGENNVA